MKSFIINSLLIASLLFLSFGCKKENSKSGSKSGKLTVTINYKPSNSSSFVHTWGQTDVRLHDQNGTVVATKSANPNNANVDFGSYSYGNYRVDCATTMISTNVNTGKHSNKNVSKSQSFSLDNKNKSVEVTMSY